MFSCFTCGTESLTNKLLKKSLKNVKPKTKKALTTQQALRLPAQPHGQEVKQSCAQPSCLGSGCGQRPVANRALVHPDSPIQQQPTEAGKQQLRDRADAAQLQLARESFINALTSALEVASRDKAVASSETATPTAETPTGSSGPSSPSSRTLSLQRSLSGAYEDASSGDESEGHQSRHGSTHDSCISWGLPAGGKAQKGFVVIQTTPTPAQAEIVPEPLSNETNEPIVATRMLRVRTAFEDFKSKRAELKDAEKSSPKEIRNAEQELAWARKAMNVSKKLQQQLPSTDLSGPMRQELEATTAELEASAVHTLSESDSDDDTMEPTPRGIMTVSAAEQAKIEATLSARQSSRPHEEIREAFSESSLGSLPSSPVSPWTPNDVQPAHAPQADFARITDMCLSNIRTMASVATSSMHLEQEDDLIAPPTHPITSPASKIDATCSAGIANSSTPFPPVTSFPQSSAQACCSAEEDEPMADASQLTCICGMIAELQLSDVLRCPKCQPREILATALSAQKPPRHPGRAYRAASLQRLRLAATC